MLAIFQISLSCFFFQSLFTEGMLPGIRTDERKKKKRKLLKAPQLAIFSSLDPGAYVRPRFTFFMQQSKRRISEVWTVLNSQQAVFQFPPDYFIGLKSWMGREIARTNRARISWR